MSEPTDQTTYSKRVKAILVHGTFATNASWDDDPADLITRDGGDPGNRKHEAEINNKSTGVFVPALRKLLRDRDEPVALDTERFLWSGENQHQARKTAADNLRDRLIRGYPTRYDPTTQNYTEQLVPVPEGVRLLDDHEYDEIYVIGHSHGGTIARLAMHMTPEEAKPRGVITFGSPFVRFKPREVEGTTNVLKWLVRVVALLLLGLVAILAFGEALPGFGLTDDSALVGSAYAVLILVLGYLADLGIRSGRNVLKDRQKMLTREYDPPPKAKIEFLSFHAVGDEAGIWLRILSFITWVFQTFIVTTLNSAYFITFLVLFGLIYGGFAWFGYPSPQTTNLLFSPIVNGYQTVAPYLGLPENRAMDPFCLAKWLPGGVIIAGAITFVLLLIATLIMAPIALFLPTLLRSSGIGFGGEPVSWTLSSEIDVDRTANETSELRVTFLPGAWTRGRIQHNYYYDAPKIQREIADRIASWRYTPRSFNWSVFETYPLETLRYLFQGLVFLLMLSGAVAISGELAKENDPSYSAAHPFCEAPALADEALKGQ